MRSVNHVDTAYEVSIFNLRLFSQLANHGTSRLHLYAIYTSYRGTAPHDVTYTFFSKQYEDGDGDIHAYSIGIVENPLYVDMEDYDNPQKEEEEVSLVS